MNKSHSWTDYQERLSRVTAYIHDHLAEELDLNRLAQVAHLSAFHWHRVYQALYGTSPTRYRAEGSHVAFLQGQMQPVATAGYTVELRQVPRVQLAGISHRGSYMQVGKAFEMAYARMAAQGLARPSRRWSPSPWAAACAPCCATRVPTPPCARPTSGCTDNGWCSRAVRQRTARCSRNT